MKEARSRRRRRPRRTDLLGLDGHLAGALGRGGELIGEGLEHAAAGDAVVELLQARLHLRHLGREEAERRSTGCARRTTHRTGGAVGRRGEDDACGETRSVVDRRSGVGKVWERKREAPLLPLTSRQWREGGVQAGSGSGSLSRALAACRAVPVSVCANAGAAER